MANYYLHSVDRHRVQWLPAIQSSIKDESINHLDRDISQIISLLAITDKIIIRYGGGRPVLAVWLPPLPLPTPSTTISASNPLLSSFSTATTTTRTAKLSRTASLKARAAKYAHKSAYGSRLATFVLLVAISGINLHIAGLTVRPMNYSSLC